MIDIDEGYPQTIKMDRSVKATYLEPLINTTSSQFYKKEQGEVYFIAAAIGYKNNVSQETSDTTDIRLYSSLRDESKLLIRLIALAHSKYDYELLRDGKKVCKIIEEYANGGMKLLHDKIFKGSDFSLEDEVFVTEE